MKTRIYAAPAVKGLKTDNELLHRFMRLFKYVRQLRAHIISRTVSEQAICGWENFWIDNFSGVAPCALRVNCIVKLKGSLCLHYK